MFTRRMLPIGLAILLILGLCVAFAGQAVSSSDYSLSTADNLTLSLSADGQITGLRIDGDELVSAPAPALWLRDLSHAGTVTTPNLLTNPGFEDGETGWRMGFQVGTLIALTDTVSHSGGWSLQMHGVQTDTSGRATVMADPVAVTPGQRYRLSAYFLSSRGYVRGLDGVPPRRQDEIWRGIGWPNGIYLRWLDGEGQPLGGLELVAPLHWEADSWRKVSGEVRAPPDAAQLELTIGGRLQDEFLWVDDLSIIASPEVEQPVTGTVAPCSVPMSSPEFPQSQRNSGELRGTRGNSRDCLVQAATLPEVGLLITATYTAEADHIAVHLELQDTVGQDRALELVWGLPLTISNSKSEIRNPKFNGWRWWDDVRRSRFITAGIPVASPPPEYPLPPGLSWTYEHVVSGVWDGWLPISLYPYALIEDGTHGLALAVSLDSPRLAKLAYDQEQGRYEARGYLGISPPATKLGGRADLSLELYRVDPAWGFRGAMDRFAARHPTWFESPRPMYDYTGYDRAYYMSEEGAQQVLTYDQEGIFAAQYIVAEGGVNDGPISEPLPTYEETIELVGEMASSPRAVDRAKSEAITQSVAHSPNGDWMIKHVGEYNWAPGVWQVAWETSTDPDIAGGWGPFLWDWAVSPAISATEAISAVLDGVMMDNFMTAPGVDTRPEHLALTDTPLTYHVATYQPGVHNTANVHEFFLWLRDTLDARGRDDMAITVNFWGIGTPNGLARHVDAFGGEGKSKRGAHSNWNPRILDYRRAIAYHKPQAWANGEPDLTLEDVREFVNLALFYGIFPTRKDDATGWEPGSDQLITEAQEVLLEFWAAGWEPLTYARADSEDVWIERFGESSTGEGLYFTVHNRTDVTRTAAITIETTPLGLTDPVSAAITDLETGQGVPFSLPEGDIVLGLTLGPRATRVLQVEGGLTPPASQCVRDANGNGIGDVVDIQATGSEPLCQVYLPLVAAQWRQPWPTLSTTVSIDVNPAHGPGSLSPLWRPSIVWQGGGVSFTNINPTLVDYWAGLGGFDRIGLVRIMPELDSLARGVYSLAEFEPLVERVRDHGGRLLVKIIDTPEEYTNTPNPPSACPPDDPLDWRYPYRYSKYGVASDKEAGFKALIQDYIRYFSQQGGTVTNRALFGDDDPHPTLGMPDVLYEVWNEPNYEYQWCDTEENFWHLYQLIVEAADELRDETALSPLPLPPSPLSQIWERGEGVPPQAAGVRGEGLLPFTIGGTGWRHETLRNDELPPAFGAPDCLAADNPNCGAIRRFYDFLQEQGYLENEHLSWWSYSYRPDEVSTGNTDWHLDRIRAILNDARYEGHYASTLVVLGEWAPPFANRFVDLLPDDEWADEYNVLFGKNINDDNEVGASLVPARIWDMTQARPRPDLQAYFTVAEWPQNDYLPLFKGTVGVFTSQTTGLIKAITNVFGLLNQLGEQELAADYLPNSRLNLLATANENGDRIAVLGWHHVNIKPYETGDVVQYNDLLAGLEADGIGPVTATLSFQNLTPGATYTQTVYVVDQTRSNAFSYRQAAADDLTANCGANPETWQRSCIYERVAEINDWTLDNTGGAASVALESTAGTLTADDQGRAEVTITLEPYSVWLVELEQQ